MISTQHRKHCHFVQLHHFINAASTMFFETALARRRRQRVAYLNALVTEK